MHTYQSNPSLLYVLQNNNVLLYIFVCNYVYNITVKLGYEAHAPITLSGKKYALNKLYVLNKQASKYVVMVFFSSNASILSFVLILVVDLCYHACALCI